MTFPRSSELAGIKALDELWAVRCKEYLSTKLLEDIVCAVLDAADQAAWRPIEEAPKDIGLIWVSDGGTMRLVFWDLDHWEDWERRIDVVKVMDKPPTKYRNLPGLPK